MHKAFSEAYMFSVLNEPVGSKSLAEAAHLPPYDQESNCETTKAQVGIWIS